MDFSRFWFSYPFASFFDGSRGGWFLPYISACIFHFYENDVDLLLPLLGGLVVFLGAALFI